MKRKCTTALLLSLVLAALPAAAASIDYTTPGAYTVPSGNCGLEVLGSTNGWIRMTLANDGVRETDLLVRHGETYPLRLASVTIYAGNPGIRVDTTPSCTCSTVLDPFAATGTCYTRSMGADECEQDDARPEIADADLVPAGPDLGLVNVGFYGSGEGDVDYLGWLQGDYGDYWRVARLREGQWNLGGARRCRLVTDSGNTYLTLIAP